jgi:hypothetical protein
VAETARRIVTRTVGLSMLIGVFAALAAVVPSETVTRWLGLIGFAAVAGATGWWASRDALAGDLSSSLRDWLVVSFLVAVGWWIFLTWFEGERDIVERLGVEFWSVMATVGLVFASALAGSLVGRGQSRAASGD